MNWTEAHMHLYYWRKNIAGGFITQLFELILKADSENRAKIAIGFPTYVSAVADWNSAPNEERFLEKIAEQLKKNTNG